MKVQIGDNLKLDVTRLIETRLILAASSGGGKSMTGRKILESTHALVPQIVLDKDGEFPSLREKFDYVLAGKGGDIPISARTAELLARKVLENKISIILDLYDLKHDEKHQFVKTFVDALINSPKELWSPKIVLIAESHHFCPENGEGSSIAKDSIIELLEAGRKRGLGTILDTQRLSKLDKSAAAECQNKLFGLTNWDDDRKRAAKELGFSTKEDVLSLRDLEAGQFYAIGPALSKQVTKTQIIKAVTSHPKIGRRTMRAPVATAKIKKVLEKLKDIPQETEVELKTVAQLKGKIKELEATIREIPKPMPQTVTVKVDENQIRAVIARELTSEYNKSIEAWLKQVTEDAWQSVKKSMAARWVPPVSKLKVVPIRPVAPAFTIPSQKPLKPFKPAHVETLSPPEEGDVKMKKCERGIVAFMAIRPDRSWTKIQVAIGSGYSVNSGGFANALGKLRTTGILSGNAQELMVDMVMVHKIMGAVPKPDSDVKTQFESHLKLCERKIWQFLEQNSSVIYTREALAEHTGYSAGSGGYANALGKLNRLGVIRKVSGGITLNPEILEI